MSFIFSTPFAMYPRLLLFLLSTCTLSSAQRTIRLTSFKFCTHLSGTTILTHSIGDFAIPLAQFIDSAAKMLYERDLQHRQVGPIREAEYKWRKLFTRINIDPETAKRLACFVVLSDKNGFFSSDIWSGISLNSVNSSAYFPDVFEPVQRVRSEDQCLIGFVILGTNNIDNIVALTHPKIPASSSTSTKNSRPHLKPFRPYFPIR